MEYGKTLTIEKESYKTILRGCTNRISISKTAFTEASKMVNSANDDLFDQIRIIYLELENYNFTYNHETQTIIVKNKLVK